MDDSDDWEPSFKHGLERTWELERLHKEKVWRAFADGQAELCVDEACKAVFNALEPWMNKAIISMNRIATFIRADTDKTQAERLCRAILHPENKMASNMFHAIVDRIKSDSRYRLVVPTPEVITIDSDEESTDNMGEDNPNETPALNSRLEATREEALTRIRTILAHEVEGMDFIFRYPLVGPGYFVVRCDRYKTVLGEFIHQFKEDPFEYKRAVRHFNQVAPKRKCHEAQDKKFCSEEEVVRKFGYRVVDTEGNDVVSDWVAESNAHVTSERKKEKAKKAAAAEGKQRSSA
ncbi:hypothetical protein N0V88_007681 [Collariella sp. IMI 366227]|nr:hypothetical protein N0V88_007681 [Collariella sp. IMI 366227]